MNAQTTRRGAPAVALWGGLGALAWAAITVLTGGSSAHADEGDPSLLNGVGSLVSQTVSTVGDTVAAVAKPVVNEVVAPVVPEVVAPVVTEVVTPVVTHVTAPVQQAAPVVETVTEAVTETVAEVPIVGQPTASVVETVTETTADTVEPVTESVISVLQDSPASQIVKPVTDVAASLPVLGALLSELGVFTLVEDLAGVVDETTAIVGGAVDDVVDGAVPPLVDALDPDSAPSSHEPQQAVASHDIAPQQATAVLASSAPVTAAAALSSASRAVDVAAAAASGASAPGHEEAPVPGPLSAPVAPSGSTGSTGASALSHARLSDVDLPVLPSVERRPGAPDDVLPTSLVADTDVSPD